jgi:hypothetical protein
MTSGRHDLLAGELPAHFCRMAELTASEPRSKQTLGIFVG